MRSVASNQQFITVTFNVVILLHRAITEQYLSLIYLFKFLIFFLLFFISFSKKKSKKREKKLLLNFFSYSVIFGFQITYHSKTQESVCQIFLKVWVDRLNNSDKEEQIFLLFGLFFFFLCFVFFFSHFSSSFSLDLSNF